MKQITIYIGVILLLILILYPQPKLKDVRTKYDSAIKEKKQVIDTLKTIISKRDTLIIRGTNTVTKIEKEIQRIYITQYEATTDSIIARLDIIDTLLHKRADTIK